ncbi:MAG TPA: helix-turn-helix transcriptional regulator [Ktedonobacteraceae bacterium]|nr:helix-turn-helix transcriptional regulator [Ktedonobacteraceae bacterium]
MEFGRRLRELRKQKNISQRDLATQVAVDFTYLSKIEGGRLAPPSEDVIRRLAQALDADENELINLAGKVPKDLKAVLEESPQAVELLRVLSERKLPNDTYRQMLDLARESDAVQPDEQNKNQGG